MSTTRIILNENEKRTVEEIIKEGKCMGQVSVFYGIDGIFPVEEVNGTTIGKLGAISKAVGGCTVYCIAHDEDKDTTRLYIDKNHNVGVSLLTHNLSEDIVNDTYDNDEYRYGLRCILSDVVEIPWEDEPIIDVITHIVDFMSETDEDNEDEILLDFLKHHRAEVNYQIEVCGFNEFDNDVYGAIDRASYEYHRNIIDRHSDDVCLLLATHYIGGKYGGYLNVDIWDTITSFVNECSTAKDVFNLVDSSFHVDEKCHNLTKVGKIETFYTGGGIWATGMYTDTDSYYIVSSEDECLTLYDDAIRNIEYGDYPCFDIVWSKDLEHMNEDEELIFHKMKIDLIENSR